MKRPLQVWPSVALFAVLVFVVCTIRRTSDTNNRLGDPIQPSAFAESPVRLIAHEQAQDPELGDRGPWFAWPPEVSPPKDWDGYRLGTLLTIMAIRSDQHAVGGYEIKEIDGTPMKERRFLLPTEVDFEKLKAGILPANTDIVFRAFPAAPWYANFKETLKFVNPPRNASFHRRLVVTQILKPNVLERAGAIGRLHLNDVPPAEPVAAGDQPVAPSIVPTLIKNLEGENRQSVLDALEVVAALGPEAGQAASALKTLATDENREFRVRYEATALLNSLNQLPDSSVPWLTGIVKGNSVDLQEKALGLIGWAGPKAREAVPLCLELLTRNQPKAGAAPPNRKAEIAAFALGRIGMANPEITRALVAGARDKKSPLRNYCLAALSELPQSAADKELIKATTDADTEIAAAAITGLGNLREKTDDNLKAILAVYDREPEGRLGLAALEALRRLGPAGRPALGEIARSYKHRSVEGREAIQTALLEGEGTPMPELVGFFGEADHKTIQGTWVSVSYEANGAPKESRHIEITVTEKHMKFSIDGSVSTFDYELDETATPKTLDMTTYQGNQVLRVNRAIYRLQKRLLTICAGGPSRPTEFKVRTGASDVDALMIFKRK